MKYIITADTQKTWTLGNLSASQARVFDDKTEGNKKWLAMKENSFFENLLPTKADDVKTVTVTLFQKKQGEKPLFASLESNWDMIRLFEMAYGSCVTDQFTYVLPEKDLEKAEFDVIEELNPDDYPDSDGDNEFHSISVVREKEHGSKFYLTERFVRYDEMLTGREDVCEICLHPYVSDFNLVKEIEAAYDDYDM